MWMSVNQFKKRFDIGDSRMRRRKIKTPIYRYETIFSAKSPEGELTLQFKRRYIRILILPENSVVLLSKKDAAAMAKAVLENIDGSVDKIPRSVWKDKNGIKVYADFRDGQNVRIRIREADSRHVFIEAPKIPHLRVQDAKELVRALRLFSKRKA